MAFGIQISPIRPPRTIGRQRHSLGRRLAVATAALACGLLVPATQAGSQEQDVGAPWTAYVTNSDPDTVSAIDTTTNTTFGDPIPTQGTSPQRLAITPDATAVYVVNRFGTEQLVTVIDTADNEVSTTLNLGAVGAVGVAISPDGTRAYVPLFNANGPEPGNPGAVAVIDTAINAVVSTIDVGDEAFEIAITPDGTQAYVTNFTPGVVSVINTVDDVFTGTTIATGAGPTGIAITPDGATAYVTNADGTVSVIDTALNEVLGDPIDVGGAPNGIAITPDGARAYVANGADGTVSVIDTANDAVVATITVGDAPVKVAITPDGARAYVTNGASATVSVIDTETNEVLGEPIAVGNGPIGVAITPDQAPVAVLTSSVNPQGVVGEAIEFDASASAVQFGTIATYDWDFGDGTTETTTTPTITHTYESAGTFDVAVTLTSSGGTSTELVFTGQTMSRNGGPQAVASLTMEIQAPPEPEPPAPVPPASEPDTAEIPETGAGTALVLGVALAAISVGLASIVATRKRSRSAR